MKAVEYFDGLFLLLRVGVRISLRYFDGVMPQQILDRDQVNSCRDKPGRESVPQIVEPQAFDARISRSFVKCPLDVPKWLARARIREDELAGSALFLLPHEDVEQVAIDRDDSRLPALGLVESDSSRGQIQLAPSQSKDLASPHSGIQSDLDNKEETWRTFL